MRGSSDVDIISVPIICGADFLAATAVDLVFCGILRVSIMPSRFFIETGMLAEKAVIPVEGIAILSVR